MHAIILLVFLHDGTNRFEGQLGHQSDLFLLIVFDFGLTIQFFIEHGVQNLLLGGEIFKLFVGLLIHFCLEFCIFKHILDLSLLC